MASVSYGNTLTDLGRNIAEQKASEQALAGILAQVGAQKLAALNALAASRGRSQAERDVGMDRNATQRQVAVMESMLRAQELGDRDRQAREAIAVAENLARIQGGFQKDVAAMPYSPEALSLARLNAQTLNPRVQETMFTENADRERMNLRAQSISTDANRQANLLYQEALRKKSSFRPLAFGQSDREIEAEYQTGINKILSNYGEDAALVRPITQPDGRVIFQPLSLPMIRPPQVPQVPPTETGTTNAVPVVGGASGGWAPAPPTPMAVPRPNIADMRIADEMAVPSVQAANAANATTSVRQNALALARKLKMAGVPDAQIQARVFAIMPEARLF